MLPPSPNQTSHTHHHLGGLCLPHLQVLVLLAMFFSPIILSLILSNQSCQLVALLSLSVTSMPREAGKLGVAAIPSISHHDSCSPSDPRGVRASLSHLSLSKLSQQRGRRALEDASKSPGL